MDNKEVVISVIGGCANVDCIPNGVIVKIKDYDIDDLNPTERKKCKEDEEGKYIELVFEKVKTQDEKIEELHNYVEDKMRLFKNSENEKGKTVIEVLQNIKQIME